MPEQTATPQPPQKMGSGLGIAALILGIFALVGAVIPFLNYVAWVIGVVGLILGIIALVQKNRRKGVAVAGTIISAVAIVLSIVLAIAYTVAFASAVSSAAKSAVASAQPSSASDSTPAAPAAGGEVTIVYEVTGTISNATITYSTLDNGNVQSATASGQALPWTKTLTAKKEGLFDVNVFSVSAVGGMESGDIGCKITVDGKVVSEQTATGQVAAASCTASNVGN